MNILIIGGTRNLGLSIVELLHERGHKITIFNRGLTRAKLPAGVERIYGDRSQKQDMEQALGSRTFEAVIDTTLYTGTEALAAVDVLKNRTGHFLFISTGQVYLVRKKIKRPFREEDYEGELIKAPPIKRESDYENWLYGMNKREAEDHLFQAWKDFRFPVTSLRAPMIHGERDHYHRLLNYVRRLQDGGLFVIPVEPTPLVRHVYVEDVASAVVCLAESGQGKGRAYNLSQDETISAEYMIRMMADMLKSEFGMIAVPRVRLEKAGLLPACSPFHGKWMSELDNIRSKKELGLIYTPLEAYLEKIVRYYVSHPELQPEGFEEAREKEKEMAQNAFD